MIGNFLGYFEKPHSNVKTALATFRASLGKIGLLFTPTSGHTGYDQHYISLYLPSYQAKSRS